LPEPVRPYTDKDAEDDISQQRQRADAKFRQKRKVEYVDQEGSAPNGKKHNKLYVIDAQDEATARHEEYLFDKHEWGAKKVVDTKLEKNEDGTVRLTLYIVDNHKYGFWRPWKDSPVYKEGAELEEKAPPGMEDWINSRKADFKKRYGDKWKQVLYATAWKRHNNESVKESAEDNPVAGAITRRILMQRTDLLQKYGPVKVGQAIDDVADFVGDTDEIGSSDVSAWVKQVEQSLASMGESVEELDEIDRRGFLKGLGAAAMAGAGLGASTKASAQETNKWIQYAKDLIKDSPLNRMHQETGWDLRNWLLKNISNWVMDYCNATNCYNAKAVFDYCHNQGVQASGLDKQHALVTAFLTNMKDRYQDYLTAYRSCINDKIQEFNQKAQSQRQEKSVMGNFSKEEFDVLTDALIIYAICKDRQIESSQLFKDISGAIKRFNDANNSKDYVNSIYPKVRQSVEMLKGNPDLYQKETLQYFKNAGVTMEKLNRITSNKKPEFESVTESDNPTDVICVDVPLFIRLMEYAREDASTDMDLHDVAENAVKLSAGGTTLSMKNYESIIPSDAVEDETIKEAGMDLEQGRKNIISILKAGEQGQDAEIMVGGEPITLEYPEARFVGGRYKAFLKAGRQEEFLRALTNPQAFDRIMAKMRAVLDKQKNFRGSVPGERGVEEGSFHNPGQEDNPVAGAITRRILMQRTDLLAKHGPEKVGQAIDSVADFVGDVDEIGSSDVSGWVKQVERELGGVAETQVNEAGDVKGAVLDCFKQILAGAQAGDDMIDYLADELNDYYKPVRASRDPQLQKAYQHMMDNGQDAEGDPQAMAQVAQQAISMLSSVPEAAPGLVKAAAGLAVGGIAAAGAPAIVGILGPLLGIPMAAYGAYSAAKLGMQGVEKLWDMAAEKLGGDDKVAQYTNAKIAELPPEQKQAAAKVVKAVSESRQRKNPALAENQYWCNLDKQVKLIPEGYKKNKDGYLVRK
jgi:hypothetical protein